MVEIIMAAYHGEKYIWQQLRSIMNNTYEDIHVSIYDDSACTEVNQAEEKLNHVDQKANQADEIVNSVDEKVNHLDVKVNHPTEMGQIVLDMQKQYGGRFTYVKNKQNKGCTRNFLEGLRESTAQYCMFSDQDDVWNQDKIEVTLRKMQELEREYGVDTPLVVFTDATVVDADLNLIHMSFHRSNHLDVTKLDLPHLLMENKLIGCTVMVNEALRKLLVQLPENARVHDWWIALLAASFGKIGYVDKSTLLYRQHEENVIGNQEYTSYIKKRLMNLKAQRAVLYSNMKQAKEFLKIYANQLEEDKKIEIERFANLTKKNWFYRRYAVLRYGYLKTGLPRIIGILLVI